MAAGPPEGIGTSPSPGPAGSLPRHRDTVFTVVTDVQISERDPGDLTIAQTERADLRQGAAGKIAQSSATTADRKRYRTRVVSTAEKANLEWAAAAAPLADGVTRSISRLF
jgi:hypothetical protein